MSYDALEAARDDGAPLFLYRFARGAAVVAELAGNASDVAALGSNFAASAIEHGRHRIGGSAKRARLDVRLPLSDPFARSFLAGAAPRVTTLTIWRGHRGDGEWRVAWKGRVEGARPDGARITLRCADVFSTLKHPGLVERATRTCRHVLYAEQGCGLDRAAFTLAATATAIDGLALTVPAAADQPDGTYLGGLVEHAGALGWITRHAGATIVTRAPVAGLVEAMAAGGTAAIGLAPGCDRSRTTCAGRFDNALNFGGFPFMPLDDPFALTSIV